MQIDGQTLPKIWIYICQLWIFVAVGALIMVGAMGSIGFGSSLGSDVFPSSMGNGNVGTEERKNGHGHGHGHSERFPTRLRLRPCSPSDL